MVGDNGACRTTFVRVDLDEGNVAQPSKLLDGVGPSTSLDLVTGQSGVDQVIEGHRCKMQSSPRSQARWLTLKQSWTR